MKFKMITSALIAVLLTNVALFAVPDERGGKTKKRQTDRLVSLLPASDAVAVFEAKRFLDEGLPRILSANQPMLSKITGHIDRIRDRVGIDVRKFDRVAVGVAYRTVAGTQADYEPVIIASASELNFGALIAGAKLVSKAAYRTETVGGKTVSIFKIDPAKAVSKPAAATPSRISSAIDQVLKGVSKELAVVSLDQNTLAIGTLARVKETLAGTSHVSPELLSLLAGREAGVMAFAMRPPGGMAKLLPLQNDELGKTLDSINYIAGSLEVSPIGTGLHVLARTKTGESALSLRDTLEVGQSFGKIAFAGKKRPDQQVYGRLIDSAKIGHHGTDVTVDVLVPQADIDVLVAAIK